MGQACGCGPKPKEDEGTAPPAANAADPGVIGAIGVNPAEGGAAPVASGEPVEMIEETKIAVIGGGVKSGKVEIMGEALFAQAPNDPNAVMARKSHKKDKSGQDFDGKRKEYVYEYINKEGGYVIDPANKKAVIKVEPGTL